MYILQRNYIRAGLKLNRHNYSLLSVLMTSLDRIINANCKLVKPSIVQLDFKISNLPGLMNRTSQQANKLAL